MEDLESRCLKYGDIVYFKVDGKQAFISAHDRATPQIRTDELSDAAESPPDLKDCLFEVTKKYQYTQKKSIANELARNGLVPEEVLASDVLSEYEAQLSNASITQKQRHALISLFNAYLREKRTNDSEFKQVIGESVLYGQVVQLRHVSTGKFVTIKRTAADVERGALKVVLDEGGQEGSWFEVFSGYRTKPEGAKLKPGEVVTLKGLAFSGNGLHVSVGDIWDPAMLPMEKHPYVVSSKEVCASPEVTAVKVIPFSVNEKSYPAMKERICGLNSVSIQDLVANTVAINVLGALNEKLLYFESPLTRPDPNRNGGPDTWRLELVVDEGFWCGMPLKHESKVRIRHLPTGCYLAALTAKAKEAARLLRGRKTSSHIHDSPGAQPAPIAGNTSAPTTAVNTSANGLPSRSSVPSVAEDDDTLYDEAFRLVLTKRYNVPDTLWEVHTFTKEETVGNKAYTFFKHVATQFWLSGAGPPIPSQGSKDSDEVQEEQVYPIAHPERLERNVMLLVKIPDDFTAKVMDLQRVMVQLKEMRHALHKEKMPPESELLQMVDKGQEDQVLELLGNTQHPDKFRVRYPALKRSLKDLVRWLDKNTWDTRKGMTSPHTEYQNLLCEMGLIDLLVQYMDAARVRLFAASSKLRNTRLGQWVVDSGKQSHRILQLSCQGNEANQAYLAKYAAMVMSHLSSPLTAPDTLAAMYENNMAQMQTVSPQIVGASVQLIRDHGHKARFVNFLRQICGTRGRPMPNNQNWIVAEIISGGQNPLEVFCSAGPAQLPDRYGQLRDTWVIRCHRKDNHKDVLVDASDFTGDEEDLTTRAIKEWDLSGDDDTYKPRMLFIYYCFSLKFIVSLCYGRNSLARDQILRLSEEYNLGLEFEVLLRAITNKALPYVVRKYMVQVLRALYVDIEPHQPLKLPRHIRMMSKKGALQMPMKSSNTSDTIMRLITTVLDQLKAVVEKGDVALLATEDEGQEGQPLDENGEHTVGRNELVLNHLKVVQEMFQLGMMDLDSAITQETLTVLLNIIQKLDSLPLDRPERFAKSYASIGVMRAKKVALMTIDFALDMKSEQQCAKVFERFAEWQRSHERQEFWAQKQASLASQGKVGMASAFLLRGRSVRSAASLSPNKISPGAGADGAVQDPEAPPERKDSAVSEDLDYGSLTQFVVSAVGQLAADNEDGDFPLFKLDTLNDLEPLHHQMESPILKLLDLVRYEDPDLTARTFQMVERMTSKREKLLEELMSTFVVTDDELITMASWATRQVERAQHAYNYMGSLDPEQSLEACVHAAAAIDALKSLLIPLQYVTVSSSGGEERIFVSKVTAANCQYLMSDMQVHMMVLKFLKLPLKRSFNMDPHRLQEAEDPARREVFRACMEFLRHFMVVGDLDGSNIPSRANQKAVLPSLELLLSFLDTYGLPVSDTIIALFITNKDEAASEGEKVIRKIMKLIIRYGDKKHAGWLELMSKVLVVDGHPIKRNQMLTMQLITQYSEEMLLLLNGEEGLQELQRLVAAEQLSARPSAEPPVSTLSYHTVCTQLLADCCFGKEPELVVRTSGYMNLAQVLDVLLLPPSADTSEATSRYVQRAYWRLLQNCYFATDTDNTKVQVRDGSNRIWPLSPEGEVGGSLDSGTSLLLQRFLDMPAHAERKQSSRMGGSCLMQAVLEEVKRALEEQSDALGNADSATYFLVTFVFPALKEYFDTHFQGHFAKLVTTPMTLVSALYNRVMDLLEAIKRLKDVAGSQQAVKSELRMALASTRALLQAMPSEANTDHRMLQRGGAPGGKPSAPSTSQQTTITPSSQRVVQREWLLYLRRLAKQVNVTMDLTTNQIVEVVHQLNDPLAAAASSLGMGGVLVFEQASLLRLARILAAKYGRRVPFSSPPMCFEKLVEMLCELLGRRSGRRKSVGPPEWQPPLLVKMVRTVCAAAVLDDGGGASDGTVLQDAWASLGLLRVDGELAEEWTPSSPQLMAWRQSKYDKLGATRAAVTLLAHPMLEVQLEALKLLEVLLQGGNRNVQSTIYDILKDGSELADAVFANIKAAFDRCRKYVARRDYGAAKSGQRSRGKSEQLAKKAVDGFVSAMRSGGTLVTGAAGKITGAAGKITGAAGKITGAAGKVSGAAGVYGSKVVKALSSLPTNTDLSSKDSQPQPALPKTPPLNPALPGTASTALPSALDLEPPAGPTASASKVSLVHGLSTGPAASNNNNSVRWGSVSRRGTNSTTDGGGRPRSGGSARPGSSSSARPGDGAVPVAEATEASQGDGGAEEEDEDEVRWEDKSAKLNNADSPYEFNRVLLRVLKNMVEGHNKHLQLIIQTQPQSASPLDLVEETVDLLNVLQDNLPSSLVNSDHKVAELMALVCIFLQEMVQGPCHPNQESLAATNFLATCNRIFGCVEYNPKYNPRPGDRVGEDRAVQRHKCNVKCALLNLLISLLEAAPIEDIPSRCFDILDFDVIDRQISRLCMVLGMTGEAPRYPPDGEDVANTDDEELRNFSTQLENELLLFSTFVLKINAVTPSRPPPLPYIVELYKGEQVEKMDSLTDEQTTFAGELQAFLHSRLGYVEINWKNQLVEPVFFNLTPECSALVTSSVWCGETLNRLNNTVSADSRAFPTVKAAELVEVLEDVVDDIVLESKLTETKWLKVVSVMARYRMQLLAFTFYLAVAALIFQALADARWGTSTTFKDRAQQWDTIVLSAAVMAQCVCTVLLYISFAYTELNKYLSHEVPTIKAIIYQRLTKIRTRMGSTGAGDPGRGGGRGNKDDELALTEGASEVKALGLPAPPLSERQGWADFLVVAAAYVWSIITFAKFWYFSMLVTASILGFIVSPFFLVFHFSIYFLDFDSGKQLVMAIQRSGINILNTFVLAVLAIYVFAVVTFLAFKDPTTVDKGDGPPCDTFYQCMGAHMLTGIMGDISSLFNSDLWDTVPSSVDQDGLQQARTIFVLAFFMLWNFVLSNIFVGLIASAFEAIRDDQNTITSDRLSRCLICSQEQYLFNEKIQGGFDEHIQKQHNSLQYVFFLHHLRATQKEDFTGAETVVVNVLSEAKTTTDKGTWLPVSKALAVIHANAASSNQNAGNGA